MVEHSSPESAEATADASPRASSFGRNAAVMLLGSVLAQGLTMAALPVLSRMYSPEAIGLQALFVSLSGTLGILATLRLDLAVVLPRAQEKALALWGLVVVQSVALAAVILLLALLLAQPLRGLLSPDAGSATWIWLLGPMVLVTALMSGQQGLATRSGQFNAIVMSNFVLSAGFVVVAVVVGLVGAPESGTVWARFAGQVAAVALLAAMLRLSWSRASRPSRWRDAVTLWREQRQFLVFNTPYSLISLVTRDLPLYVFAISGSIAVSAAYALARTVTLAPTMLVSAAVSRVFYREAALHLGTPRLEQLARSLTRAGLLLSLPAFAFMLVWGDRTFEVVFGAQWTTAGEFAQRLAIPLWLALQTGWPERLFEAARRQNVSFVVQLGFDAVHAVAILTSYLVTHDALLSVTIYACTLSCYQVSYLAAAYRVAGFDVRSLARLLVVSATAFAGCAGLFVVLRTAVGGDVALVLSGAGVLGLTLLVTLAVGQRTLSTLRLPASETQQGRAGEST